MSLKNRELSKSVSDEFHRYLRNQVTEQVTTAVYGDPMLVDTDSQDFKEDLLQALNVLHTIKEEYDSILDCLMIIALYGSNFSFRKVHKAIGLNPKTIQRRSEKRSAFVRHVKLLKLHSEIDSLEKDREQIEGPVDGAELYE